MGKNTQPLEIVNHGAYLAVWLPPYESLETTEAQIAAIYHAVDHHHAPKLLIDSRATRERLPIVELYELGVYVVSKFGPLLAKLAVVVAPEATYSDRFGETVMRNRGLDALRFVNSEQAALEWLLAPLPSPQP